MPGSYTLVSDSQNPMTIVGTLGQITLNRREVRMAAFGLETQEVWYATTLGDALAYQVDLLSDQRVADFKLTQDSGETFRIDVLWCYDRNNSQWTVGSDLPLWNLSLVETSLPLEFSPYFLGRISSDPSVPDLQNFIPKIDQWLAVGAAQMGGLTLPSTAASQAILQRYAGMRTSGISEYSPVVVSLSSRFRLFSSLTGETSGTVQSYKYLLQAINMTQTLTKINPPAEILVAINNMSSLLFGVDGGITPSITTPILAWVRQKPDVNLSGNNPLGPRDVTMRWFGYQNVAAVLYPPASGTNTGQFDPKKTTAFT